MHRTIYVIYIFSTVYVIFYFSFFFSISRIRFFMYPLCTTWCTSLPPVVQVPQVEKHWSRRMREAVYHYNKELQWITTSTCILKKDTSTAMAVARPCARRCSCSVGGRGSNRMWRWQPRGRWWGVGGRKGWGRGLWVEPGACVRTQMLTGFPTL